MEARGQEALYHRRAQSPHRLGVLAEGPHVDDRVVRVGVHVQHRAPGDIDAYPAPFKANGVAPVARELVVVCGPQGHQGRNLGPVGGEVAAGLEVCLQQELPGCHRAELRGTLLDVWAADLRVEHSAGGDEVVVLHAPLGAIAQHEHLGDQLTDFPFCHGFGSLRRSGLGEQRAMHGALGMRALAVYLGRICLKYSMYLSIISGGMLAGR